MKLLLSVGLLVTGAAAAVDCEAKSAFPSSVTGLMDMSADPCDDFFQYSCGTWVKNTKMPDDKSMLDYMTDLITDRNEVVIQEIMKEDHPLVSDLWNSCNDVDTLNALGNKPLQDGLRKIQAANSTDELFAVAGELGQYGPEFLGSVDVAADAHNTSINVFHVYAASLSLPDLSYYFNDTFFDIEPDFRTYISTIMELSGYLEAANINSSYVEDVVIGMQFMLANFSIEANIAESDDDEPNYYPISYAEAVDTYPLTFGQYTKGFGLQENSEITDKSLIVFSTLEYYDAIEDAVGDIEVEDLKAYLAFLYVDYFATYLSDDFNQANFDFYSVALSGQTAMSTRSTTCTSEEIHQLPDLVGQYYYAKMFDTKREDNTRLMVKLIEEALEQHIEKLYWLDEPTRKAAEAKLAKVTELIGRSTQKQSYPYTLDAKTYLANIQTIAADKFTKDLRKIGQTVDKTEWRMSAATVNAYYAPLTNQIVFPAAILQPPMYNGSSHPAQNFGAIGATIGHELTHGFDTGGRNYDSDGNRVNWWSEKTSEEFEKRANCLADEYSNFEVDGENGSLLGYVDGNLTISENIADNGGLNLAFDAYNTYMASASHDTDVPAGTELSKAEAEQLFFVSFAQSWCRKYTDAEIRQRLTGDTHAPGKWRINGPVMNSADFASAFQCKAGAKMNPKDKCVLW